MGTSAGTLDSPDADAKIRCSDRSRAAALSPIGTAGTQDGFVLVEMPLPWPRDVGRTPEGVALAPLLAPRRHRLQAVVPADPAAPPQERGVILHSRPPGPGFNGYRRLRGRVGASLTATVAALLEAAADPAPSEFDAPGVDVLVCTHGTRDSCCGRRGAALAVRAADVPGAEVRRTSHLGGHRFAPTFLVLPQGTAWGYADPELVTKVVRREVPFGEVAEHYRGCTGLDGPQVQALELEVLRKVGWSLLDVPRTGTFDGTWADLSWREDGQTVIWAADVRAGRAVPMPRCMEPATPDGGSETEWDVTAVYRCQ
ncbi:sucrase ferredoxin [Actinocorallia longicatena]|uniref:Sucrase ferredoxin n=1 Tax=Actinocorallia longicatena TaxID=111803 RepID=A0ABP6QLQ9_9ACTN